MWILPALESEGSKIWMLGTCQTMWLSLPHRPSTNSIGMMVRKIWWSALMADVHDTLGYRRRLQPRWFDAVARAGTDDRLQGVCSWSHALKIHQYSGVGLVPGLIQIQHHQLSTSSCKERLNSEQKLIKKCFSHLLRGDSTVLRLFSPREETLKWSIGC